jgi:hypothetical protein
MPPGLGRFDAEPCLNPKHQLRHPAFRKALGTDTHQRASLNGIGFRRARESHVRFPRPVSFNYWEIWDFMCQFEFAFTPRGSAIQRLAVELFSCLPNGNQESNFWSIF